MTGQKYGRLVCIKKDQNKSDNKNAVWVCRCQCGRIKSVRRGHLVSGNVTSCGCYSKEVSSERLKKHGLSLVKGKQTRLHTVWTNMINRCHKGYDKDFKNYGARGVVVCDEWRNDFLVFHRWATDNGYSDKLTIERIDNNKGYYPGNCRWATTAEQNRNTRATKLTRNQVIRMRSMFSAGEKVKNVAEVFKISPSHARSIKNGHRWKVL